MAKSLRHLPAILGVALLAGAIYVVQREFRNLKINDISSALDAIPNHALVVGFCFTIVSYGVLTFYDRLGTIYAGHKVSYRRVAFASFCAYALSHNLGFAAVSGAAVRYRLYAHWGLTPLQIGKVVAFCSLTFGLGGMVLGGSILILEPTAVPFFGPRLPTFVMYGIALGLWAIVAAYVTLARVFGVVKLFGHVVELPGLRMAVLQVLLATVDVAVTAAIFQSLLPAAPGLTFLRFLAVYVASYTAGLAANLPGGIGVFDTAMLLGLAPYLEAPTIVGAIVVFRLYYYVIPLFLAGSLFAGNEILLRSRSLIGGRGARRGGARWSEPDFAVAAATGTVALCGAMLLSLGVLAPPPDFSWIDPDYAFVAAEAGQFVPSLIGAALMVLAIGLSRRVTLAWGVTLVMLLLGASFTVAQGTHLWIPGVLVLALFLIAPYRQAFYRPARLFSGPLQAATAVPLFALIVCVLMLSAFEQHVRGLAANSWWEVVLSPEVPNSFRASMAFTVLVGLVATWRLIRPGRVGWLEWSAAERQRYAALGGAPPAEADGIVWGEGERAGIPFRRVGGLLLALGDPAGQEADRISAIWRLRDLAAQEGLDPAVYRAGPGLLRVYGNLGLDAFPLGADGLPLPEQDGDTTPPAAEYLVCQAERDLGVLLPLLGDLAAHPHQRAAAAQ
jgi:phosphatidylglycerol lysyltransferase